MKDIIFIDGKTNIRIEDEQLAAYLDRVEAAGYVIRANKCKSKGGFSDVLMIGMTGDFEEFFSGKASIKEIYKESPQVYRLFFDHRELMLYILGKSMH